MMIRRSPLPRRRQPIARSTTPIRKARPNPVNRKRRDREFVRCYGSVERVEFVKSLKCIATGQYGTESDPVENAHIGSEGKSRKAASTRIVPLRRSVHQVRKDSLHALGRAAFELQWGVDLHAAAVMTEAKWIAHCARAS